MEMEGNASTGNPTATTPSVPAVVSSVASTSGGPLGFIGRNKVTIMIVSATVVLAGVAIFTAARLYQMRQQPTPDSIAQTSNLGLSPTPLATIIATPTPTATAAATGSGGFLIPTATPSATPIASSSAVLPNSGMGVPTIIGAGVGALLISLAGMTFLISRR